MKQRIFQRKTDACLENSSTNHIESNLGLRISSVFVILALSSCGSFLPLIARRCERLKLPEWFFFLTRYFGSGVIVATGFVHLMADANESLGQKCLGDPFTTYPWADAIALMSLFSVFVFDVLAHKRLQNRCKSECCQELEIESGSTEQTEQTKSADFTAKEDFSDDTIDEEIIDEVSTKKMLNAVILECGVVFHSIFVGLSLAIADDTFISLYIAICFHQLFEGLGLGTRFAAVKWPKKYAYVPWLSASVFGLATSVAIAGGLGMKSSYSVNSRTGIIVRGVFDSLCAGVLIYSGVSELMAYDFIYSNDFRDRNTKTLLIALFLFSMGALIMAVLGKWA